jgi:hypothetical protein
LNYSTCTITQIANRLDDFPGSSNAFNVSTCEVTEMADAESFPVSVQVGDQFSQSTSARGSRRKQAGNVSRHGKRPFGR